MTNPILKRFIVLSAVTAAAVIVICCIIGLVPPSPVAPVSHLTGTDGNPVASVSIADLDRLSTVTHANYTPDEFLIPKAEISGTPVDLRENNRFAERGTLIFVIRNLNPTEDDFLEQSESLQPYLHGDYCWHFTLYIPAVWSACNVYVNYMLTDSVGSISDYDFIRYSDLTGTSVEHTDATKPITLDLTFSSRQSAIPDDILSASTIVTVHYESRAEKTAGITDTPLIGSANAVNSATKLNQTLSTILFVLAALIIAIFLFVCLLKKNPLLLPHLFIVLGIFGMLFSSFLLTTYIRMPFFWKTIRSYSVAVILVFTLWAVRGKKKLSPVWITVSALSFVFALSTLILPLLPFDITPWEYIYKATCVIFFAAAIIFFVLGAACKTEKDLPLLVNPLLVAITAITLCLPYSQQFAVSNPSYYMCAAVLLYTASLGGNVFINQEKALTYLTENLQEEVQIRTMEMRAALEERDELFRYVSHDMKKPLHSIDHFVNVVREREKDAEQQKALEIISRKISELLRDFSDLSQFSKSTFAAEDSSRFEINDLLQRAEEDYQPDCSANGIILKVTPCKITVYGKINGLYSVISNIILNSIEHSGCKNIYVSAQKKKNVCIISVSDDGKGIQGDRDIFYPYYSESAGRGNTGLGLYISKSFMRSMNGELSYTQNDGLLTFNITVPLG